MIRANSLSLRRGSKPLLENTSFTINPNERIGIVGRNGAGKSSLFALILGQIDQETGDISIPKEWRIAHVRQDVLLGNQSATEFVIDGDINLRNLQSEYANTDTNDGVRLSELEAALSDAGTYTAQSRAEQLLSGLGFGPSEWSKAIGEFSGGWQMRLALARALMMPSDLLLLDEPTNHLDLDAMIWLEKWLSRYDGTVLIISHDTDFLNSTVQNILSFENKQLIRYKGNYDQHLIQKAEKHKQHIAEIEKQKRESERLQNFIDRFKAKASKAKQAQSRIKALSRMQKLAPLQAEGAIHITLPTNPNMPDPLLVMEDLSVGYEQKPVLQNISLMLRGGDRIGMLGMNGAGKSTLVKTLADGLPLISGAIKPSKGIKIGYFAQHQLDMLNDESTPLQHLQLIADPNTTEQELRNYLGQFAFTGDVVCEPIAPFSGGEKARLALALVVWKKPNLLILDEPSNHLDIVTREALAEALAQFDGSMLLVSHDRQLLKSTVDKFWIVYDGNVHEFDGDLDDYAKWIEERKSNSTKVDQKNKSDSTVDKKATKRLEAEERQRKFKLKKPLEQKASYIEENINNLENKISEYDALIADESFYAESNRDNRLKILNDHQKSVNELKHLEEEWFDVLAQIEELENN
ncbi:ABC-F family ATP-binding cassette domain-containing protein [Taylorella equigenitalis]|uniref:ABC-F family ATP-binding cassette domain-containing protein n=1 Tax=Taylorella equigenitalis TaxID=29575 RepID=UPI00041DE241|nr:ATP-binding cassette domain-containing protein [Taylorella equigenitalis]ASY30577.1 ABC transporter [Taylorella equigenitalis]ASY37884.1 ABC transporter [Taylorella equigenitalis]ASY42304.1 ABC transporter [Taylorella equigenitalis]KGK32905.1 ABC transporter [Taylorella equigenitalis]KOS59204.1 ABC transporter [Taylorella equigenitalis]